MYGEANAREEGRGAGIAAPAVPFLKAVLYPDDEGSVLPAVEASQGAAETNVSGGVGSSATAAPSGSAVPVSVLPRTAATLAASLD